MKKVMLVLCYSLVFAICSSGQKKAKPIPVIFDSDMGPDYDDVGALAVLHAFTDSGYVNLLATISSTRYKDVAGVFDVLNTYFNRPDMPVAVCGSHGLQLRDFQHWSDTLLANYPHRIQSNNEVPEAVELYRKILSEQADTSVTIITVGFMTNLSDLLRSPPDKYSALGGAGLVKQKVKQLVSMAGIFPTGVEFNVASDAASSQYVFQHWPTKVLLTGFEIGHKIKVGVPLMKNDKIRRSPVKDVFRISIPQAKADSAGRMSWDQTAVLIAVKGYQPFYTLHMGTMVVGSNGRNTWNDTGTGHAYVVEKIPAKQVEAYIEKLIRHQPMKRRR